MNANPYNWQNDAILDISGSKPNKYLPMIYSDSWTCLYCWFCYYNVYVHKSSQYRFKYGGSFSAQQKTEKDWVIQGTLNKFPDFFSYGHFYW